LAKDFRFKKFTIQQDRCAMKVGTDGVLLGAWTSLENEPSAILDIGAGTGLIALLLAQRSSATIIDAIEIEADAYEQCVANFEASSWADRLFGYHAGLDEFVSEIEDRYDLIVSNPPFYSETVSSGHKARDLARQRVSLPFEELVESTETLLSKNGIFATIIPYKEEVNFIRIAKAFDLFPKYITHVKGTKETPIKRSLLAFTRSLVPIVINELIIEEKRNSFTEAYRMLTKDFYLKM